MVTVERPPLARCDNCGTTEEKVHRYGSDKWSNPDGWGGIKVDAMRGAYPNNITMSDLCPRCLKTVHAAVSGALKNARSDADDTGWADTDEKRIARGLDPNGGFDGPTGAD